MEESIHFQDTKTNLEVLAKALATNHFDSASIDFYPRQREVNDEHHNLTTDLKKAVLNTSEQTKDKFDSHAHRNILVIGAGATYNAFDEIPWLAFYDQKLQLDELYFLKHQKELVVLSACKTSVGTHKKGEGLYSITRGFINSGAKSVLSTLWDVNERSSSEIISEFYKGIADEKLKSTSLRTAKLSYVSSNTNTSLASPYYWSSIILTGNNDIIETDSQIGTYVLITSIILLLLFGFYFFFRNRKSNLNK